MTIQSQIEEALKTKTSWVFVDELVTELQFNRKQVGGTLRKLFAKDKTVRKIISGSSQRLWASKEVFDSMTAAGTFLTEPVLPTPAPKKPKKVVVASARPTAANSVRRNRTMCLPNKPTLVQAVTDLVNEKMTAQEKFSAHDVTKALREKLSKDVDAVSAGLTAWAIDVAETGTVFVSGHKVPKIEHDDVREVLSHLWNTGAMGAYQRDSNGQYMEYGPAAVATPPDPTLSNIAPDPAPAGQNGSDYDGSSSI